MNKRSTGVQMTETSNCEFTEEKKKLKGRKTSDLAAEHRKCLSAHACRDGAVSSTSIRKWWAGLWLHQCYCPHIVNLLEKVVCAKKKKFKSSHAPHTNSFSNMRSLWTSSWNGKTWGHLSVPWWMWTFRAVENRWGIAGCRVLKHPTSKLSETYTWLV